MMIVAFFVFAFLKGQDVCPFFTTQDCHFSSACHVVEGVCVADPCFDPLYDEDNITADSCGAPPCTLQSHSVQTPEGIVNYRYCVTGERYIHDMCYKVSNWKVFFNITEKCTETEPHPGCGSSVDVEPVGLPANFEFGSKYTFCTLKGYVPHDFHEDCRHFSASDCHYNPSCEVVGEVCVPDYCYEEISESACIKNGSNCKTHVYYVNDTSSFMYCTNGSRLIQDACNGYNGFQSGFSDEGCANFLSGCGGKESVVLNGPFYDEEGVKQPESKLEFAFCTRKENSKENSSSHSNQSFPILVLVSLLAIFSIFF